MNTTERIAKVRELTPFDFMNGANYVLVQQLCDELEAAQAVVERVEAERQVYRDMGEDDDVIVMLNFLDKLLAPLKPNYAQMVTDDEEALEDA